MLRARLARKERPAQVGLHHAVPLLDRHIEHCTVRKDAGVGHHDRNGAKHPLRSREKTLHRFLVPHVDNAGEDPIAAQPGCRMLDRVFMQIAERYPTTGGVERLGDA
jgi:hypothetical protein